MVDDTRKTIGPRKKRANQRTRFNEMRKARREKRKASGLCTECGEPLPDDAETLMCDFHRDQHRKIVNASHKRSKLSSIRREKNRARWRREHHKRAARADAKGLCRYCHLNRCPRGRQCDDCRAAHALTIRLRERAARMAGRKDTALLCEQVEMALRASNEPLRLAQILDAVELDFGSLAENRDSALRRLARVMLKLLEWRRVRHIGKKGHGTYELIVRRTVVASDMSLATTDMKSAA